MVGRAAIFEIMIMVGDEVAVDARLEEDFREGIVEGFERPPTPVQEAQAARLHVAAGRHAGQAADIVPVEGHRPLGQPVEIRRGHACPP